MEFRENVTCREAGATERYRKPGFSHNPTPWVGFL
jgi:hypothetical protein